MNGVKSSLVEHVFRLLRQRPVDWVVLENVPFMLQLAKGEALKFVVTELEKLNYRWAYRVIDSLAFGLPQRRRRVFIVASRVEDPRRVLFTGNETPHLPVSHATDSACGFYWTEGNRGLGWAVDAVPTLKSGSAIGIASPPGVWLATGLIGKPDIRDGERLQGFPVDWTLPGDTGRVGVRWRLVGNAVTVDVAAWLGERLRALDGTLLEGVPLEREDRWPDVAWNVGAGRRTAALSSWPVCVRSIRLNEFLSYPLVPLSERATEGFYTRFTASSLKKPKGFVNALSAHLDSMRASKAHTEPKRNARSKR
jgi:DNA (cytosine-5)-methyltransferase 1